MCLCITFSEAEKQVVMAGIWRLLSRRLYGS
jgi:hypothetical protein